MTRSKWLKQDSPSPEAISKVQNNYKSQTHPLSRLEGNVGSHPPCYSRGACTDLLRRAWGQDMTSWDCLASCSTHARPSSASRTWAWSPCRPWSDGARGKVLPAAKKASSEPNFVVSYVRFSSRLTFWENLSSESLPAITEVCSKYLAPVSWQSPSCVTLLTIDPLKHIWMFDAIADLLCQPMFLEISKCEKSHLGNQFSILNHTLSILKTTFHHPSQLSRFALKYKLYSD